jgi:membrane protease YdiL (CAAX protease family)
MDDDLPTPRNFALIAAIFEGGLAVAAVVLGWLVGQVPLETFRWSWAATGLGAAGTLPPLALLWLCLSFPVRPLAELTRVIDDLLVPMFAEWRLVEFAVVAALAGVGEEMLFRGVIQAALAEWIGGPAGMWVGLAAAALLFALAHFVTPTYAIVAGLIGLYLGGLWLATGNLLVPIVTHAGYDLAALIYLVRIRAGKPAADKSAG